MTKDELIVTQALRIEDLKVENLILYKRMSNIQRMLTCVGGPLNDNRDKFNKQQMKILVDIYENCE